MPINRLMANVMLGLDLLLKETRPQRIIIIKVRHTASVKWWNLTTPRHRFDGDALTRRVLWLLTRYEIPQEGEA
ncbi:MAG: hypothetical protein ACREBG_03115 [Pyrinomonadaceae bacterium]